ncbi:zinc dependent phospholipase C family protein [Oceanobacillus kimchii]|uniref:zinc dependent phospholipase C family protein n=1 Tax=Oceanobacillus kimchii TaxID=746691 RepID=UPI00232FA62D|nr:zinc dependent phospholipase C family protein [Oceanobacillus kimchii]
MPNIWTHILFAEDACNSVDLSIYTGPALNLGAQGPDPFFYYQFWPWVKEGLVQQLGTTLHTKQCGEFLQQLIQRAKKCNIQVQAYVLGFITHHILDRHTHPFIHYHAGYEGSNHQKLEVIIDTIMMQKLRKKEAWKFPVYLDIDVGDSLPLDIHQILEQSIRNIYPDLTPPDDYIKKSYHDMKLAHKILADPYLWKNKLLSNVISSYSHQPIRSSIDYLNEGHNIWHHPATYVPSTRSFLEHYEDAHEEICKLLPLIHQYWVNHNYNDNNLINDFIDNISYDTGMPLSLELENIYSNPII